MLFRGRWTGASLRVFDIGARALGKLLKQKSAFDAEAFDLALRAGKPEARGVVGLFDFLGTTFELNAFPTIGFFHRGRECRGYRVGRLGRHGGH